MVAGGVPGAAAFAPRQSRGGNQCRLARGWIGTISRRQSAAHLGTCEHGDEGPALSGAQTCGHGTDRSVHVGRVLRDWLILGPVPMPDVPKATEKDTLPNELQLSPDEGENIGGQAWRKIAVGTATLDFRSLFGAQTNVFAYAMPTFTPPPVARMCCNSPTGAARGWCAAP